MYNKNLEKLIPIALEVIENHKKDMSKDGKIKSEFNGYFSSFGPSVLMAGLKQTVIFYDNDDNGKKLVNTIIFEIIKKMDWHDSESTLKNLVLTYNPFVKSRVLEIVTACKLAIRTFEFSEE